MKNILKDNSIENTANTITKNKEDPVNNLKKTHNEQYKKTINNKLKGFNKFNLKKEVILSILKLGYKMPTPIQRKVIPELLSGFNVIAKSRTGSGKSASFIIPTVEKLISHSDIVGSRAVILSPTRELAKQTLDFFYKLTKGMNLKFAIMTGGDKIEGQYEKLATNPDVIIATPGRLVHHLEEGSVSLKKVEVLIIDEADKLIEQGFEDQINQILKVTPNNKQVGLFSATIPEQLANFMKIGIKDYKLITLEDENKIPETLKLHMISCRSEDKNISLVTILKYSIDINNESTLVFCPTKYHCEYLHLYLKCYGINTLMIYGNMDQSLRDNNFANFKNKRVNVLLVTDVAARGLDIPKLENVINYDFPDKAKLFIHRIGRTARAGKFGKVISLVTPSDIAYLMDTKIYIGKRIISCIEDYLKYAKTLKNNNNLNIIDCNLIKNALEDCSIISYGIIPKSKYDSSISSIIEYVYNKTDFEDIEKSIKNAMIKKEKFKEKPSGAGIKSAKQFEVENKISISPLFIDNSYQDILNNEENKLASILKKYKPKKTIFEQINSETNVEHNILKSLRRENKKHLYKKDVEKKKDEFKVNNNAVYTRENILNNNEYYKEYNDDSRCDSVNENIYKESIENDNVLNSDLNVQQNNVNDCNNDDKILNKKRKRIDLLKDIKEKQFIGDKPDKKTSSDHLWGKEGPLTLNELTLNICPDDTTEQKKKSQYVWDDKKKKYVTGISDKKGNLIRKNESGVKIKDNEKRVSSYKKWLSTSKIRVQRVGEKEDLNIVSSAGDKYRERKHVKNTKNSNKNNKNEIKNYNQLIKDKKQNSRKKTRFSGQSRNLEERKIADKLHKNRNSFVMVKRKNNKNFSRNKKGFNKKRR